MRSGKRRARISAVAIGGLAENLLRHVRRRRLEVHLRSDRVVRHANELRTARRVLERLRNDHRDRLAVELHRVVLQEKQQRRHRRRAAGIDARRVLVRHDAQHAG